LVETLQIKCKTPKTIYFVGDLHVGTKNFAEEEFLYTIEKIKKDKDALVVLMGDMGEYIVPDDRRFDIENIHPKLNTTERQYHFVRTSLEPIKDKIIGIVEGNHDFVIKKKSGFDIIHLLSHDFDCKYLQSMGIIKLTIGDYTYNIVVAHGNSAATTVGGHVNRLMKLVSNFEVSPDVTVMGHVHALQTICNPKLDFDFNTNNMWLGLSGCYFKTYEKGLDNYGTKQMYSPLTVGCCYFKFNELGDIEDGKLIF